MMAVVLNLDFESLKILRIQSQMPFAYHVHHMVRPVRRRAKIAFDQPPHENTKWSYRDFFSEVSVVCNVSKVELFNLEPVVSHQCDSYAVLSYIEWVNDSCYEWLHEFEVGISDGRRWIENEQDVHCCSGTLERIITRAWIRSFRVCTEMRAPAVVHSTFINVWKWMGMLTTRPVVNGDIILPTQGPISPSQYPSVVRGLCVQTNSVLPVSGANPAGHISWQRCPSWFPSHSTWRPSGISKVDGSGHSISISFSLSQSASELQSERWQQHRQTDVVRLSSLHWNVNEKWISPILPSNMIKYVMNLVVNAC